MRLRLITIASSLLAVALISGFTFKPTTTDDLEAWMAGEAHLASTRLSDNISPAGTRRGVILASPSQKDPNYYYYWVRDGAMVMRAVYDSYEAGDLLALTQMRDYVQFSRENQIAASANLGEPRFNVDGSVNTEPWGRPQNDGPALRALTLIRYARSLLKRGDRASVERDLYVAEMPARSVIKTDLEFTAHHWRDKSVDLWEEVWGYHFFTEAAQLAALREGSKLAAEMGDAGAGRFYSEQADLIEVELAKHWDSSKGYYLATREFSAGPDHVKDSQLDVSVLLAALFVEQTGGLLDIADDHIIKTASAIEAVFAKIYAINTGAEAGLATAIGRYSEDTYFGGNPWALTTAAYAEWNYRLAAQVSSAKSFVLTRTQAEYFASVSAAAFSSSLKANTNLSNDSRLRAAVVAGLRAKGDAFMKRVQFHAGLTGHLAEQIDRNNGSMISARDLSWSYAAYLRAAQARSLSK